MKENKIQEKEISVSELDELIEVNKGLFDKLNIIESS